MEASIDNNTSPFDSVIWSAPSSPVNEDSQTLPVITSLTSQPDPFAGLNGAQLGALLNATSSADAVAPGAPSGTSAQGNIADPNEDALLHPESSVPSVPVLPAPEPSVSPTAPGQTASPPVATPTTESSAIPAGLQQSSLPSESDTTPVQQASFTTNTGTQGLIGDRVWLDADDDGVQGASEQGLEGVEVNLLDSATLTVIASMSTTTDGTYSFVGVATGSYIVEFVAPTDMTFTTPHQGSDATLDSDAMLSTGQTSAFLYTADEVRTDLDAGLVSSAPDDPNDAPLAVVPLTKQHTPEDTPLVFSSAGANSVWLIDIDAGQGEMLVSLSATSGVLHLATTQDLTLVAGATGSPFVSFTATLAASNAALDGLTFTPSVGFVGLAEIDVTVNDQGNTGTGGPLSDDAHLEISVGLFATDDDYTVEHDQTLTEITPGVLGNDSEPWSLTAQLVSGPAHGSVTLAADGSFSYTPNTGYVGTDEFSYSASDGIESDTALVTITVVNSAPVANDDDYGVHENETLVVDAMRGLLRNDFDPEDDNLTAQLVTGPSSGTLGLNGDGSFVYTPATDYTGTVTFAYLVSDGLTNSAPAIVTLNIHESNTAPVAEDDAYVIHANEGLSLFPSMGILDNDGDADGDLLSVSLLSPPQHGTLTLNVDGSLNYTPAEDFVGTDSFSYTLSDGLASDTATVTIEVTNAPPVALDQFYDVHAGESLSVGSSSGLLIGSYDPDPSDTYGLTAELVTGPTIGTLDVQSDGSFDYTPPPDFTGTVTFTYQLRDAVTTSNVATAIISVNNEAPIGTDDLFNVWVNTATDQIETNVLDNDTDLDGDTFTVVQFTQPQHAETFTLDALGGLTYEPEADYVGLDSFTYRISDGVSTSEPITVTLTVTGTIIGVTDYYELPESGPLDVTADIGVLSNDFGPASMVAELLTGPVDEMGNPSGSVALNADGSFLLTPDSSYSGSLSFTYRAVAGLLASMPVTVFISQQGGGQQGGSLLVDRLTFETPHGNGILKYDTEKFNKYHWHDVNRDGKIDENTEKKHPVSYTRTDKLKVQQVGIYVPAAKLQEYKDNKDKLKLKGTVKGAPGNIKLEAKKAELKTVDGDDLIVVDGGWEANAAFDGKVNVYDEMTIDWELSKDDGTSYVSVGSTKTQVYLTLNKPDAKVTLFHTVIDIGSRNAAGKDKQPDVITAVVTRFKDPTPNAPKIKRVDPAKTVLHYYKSFKTKVSDTAGLLKSGDGECGAWSRFFLDVLRAQGISNESNLRFVKPLMDGQNTLVLFVNTVEFVGQGTSGVQGYPYVNESNVSNSPAAHLNDTSYNWKKAEVKDVAGEGENLPGQAVQNPASIFSQHIFARVIVEQGKVLFFDPSYGQAYHVGVDNLAANNVASAEFLKNVAGVSQVVTAKPQQGKYVVSFHVKKDKANPGFSSVSQTYA